MGDKQIIKKKKGFLIKNPGTRGQTYYGSASAAGTPFFKFNVVDNLKRAGKNIKKLLD
jgi:hypothetical protein|tara:strand:- start:329 stop:502 length:174 start_codon:yes stop_codon:yes gene_type:complete